MPGIDSAVSSGCASPDAKNPARSLRTFGTYNSNDRVARLEGALDAGDIPFESRTQTGGHDWDFWRASFPEIVLFHSAAFGPGEAPGVCAKTSAHRPPGDDGDRP